MPMHSNDTCGSCGSCGSCSPRTRRHWAAWLTAAFVVGCGGGELLLVPFFTYGFSGPVGSTGSTVFLNLNPNAPTTSSGPFAEFSTITLDANPGKVVTGNYAGCTFTLTVTNPVAPLVENYNGRFTSADVMVLTPTQGAQPSLPALTLTRAGGNQDLRPTTC